MCTNTTTTSATTTTTTTTLNQSCSRSWNGITCDAGKNRIIAFDLGLIPSLAGVLPTAIDTLSAITSLTSLTISNSPGIKGSIPTQIGLISSLSKLIVQGTSVSGSIPRSLSRLYALTRYAASSEGQLSS